MKKQEVKAFMELSKRFAKFLGKTLVHEVKRQYEKKHGSSLMYTVKK